MWKPFDNCKTAYIASGHSHIWPSIVPVEWDTSRDKSKSGLSIIFLQWFLTFLWIGPISRRFVPEDEEPQMSCIDERLIVNRKWGYIIWWLLVCHEVHQKYFLQCLSMIVSPWGPEQAREIGNRNPITLQAQLLPHNGTDIVCCWYQGSSPCSQWKLQFRLWQILLTFLLIFACEDSACKTGQLDTTSRSDIQSMLHS